MEESQKYWIWLQNALGVNNKRFMQIIDFFETAENVYLESEKSRELSGLFNPSELLRLSSTDESYGLSKMELCEKYGFNIIQYGSKDYPERLKPLNSPPIVLYTKGKFPESDLLHVGMVGTRNPNESGRCLAYNYAYDLTLNNTVIVSGGALGVDNFSHMGCIDAGGSTICVLGCSIDSYSLKISSYILDEVPKNGVIVSEYPPVFEGSKYSYPVRNRIISSFSDCLLVVQAGFGSGAIITAKYAYVQNKKIFTMPGDAGHINSSGTNFMIKNGFSFVLNYNEILRWHDEPHTEENGGNPYLDRQFFEVLSNKPDIYKEVLQNIDKRKLSPPECYRVTAAIYSNFGDDFRELLLIPIEDTEKNEIKIEEKMSKTDEEVEPDKIPETDKKEEFGESKKYLSGKNVEEKCKKFIRIKINEADVECNKEYYIQVLKEISDRAIRRIPEPLGSPIEMIIGDSNVSKEEVRLNIIEFLCRIFDKNSGVYDLPKQSVKGFFYPEDEYKGIILQRMDFSENFQLFAQTIADRIKEEKSYGNNIQLSTDKIHINVENEQNQDKVLSEQLTENALSVYHTISDTPIHVDSIIIATKLDVRKVLSALTELVMADLVEQLPGRRYIRK